MKLKRKIKAGALQFVLFIGSVIAILLISFALISHIQNLFRKKTDLLVDVIKASEEGIVQNLISSPPLNRESMVDISAELDIQLKLKRNFWGVFEKWDSEASFKNSAFRKMALVGSGFQDISALYLKDAQRPLIMAGNAMISGNAYLPEKGIKAGNIYGNSFHQSQLVFGQIQRSKTSLPELGVELKTQLTSLSSPNFEPMGEELLYRPGLEYKKSFKEDTRIIKGQQLFLEDLKLSGNIVVWAAEKITVDQSALLQDVILIAPEIEIRNWVNGHFQAIASRKISVGKNCDLQYPSALIVMDQRQMIPQHKADTEPAIYMGSFSELRGVVAVFSDKDLWPYAAALKLDEHARVSGEVFCSYNTEHKGLVNGHLSTAGFVALENGRIYNNHLYNGRINSSYLPISYGGLLLEDRLSQKKIVKWLY
ncbi:hypothetical protein [Poritiphilus flavus]|uniref:Uncharacterized protein n=1 Tax=Poritiphilus flavus TaxID=2697053 RepID=A0A6L9EE89_9FLAO|nr:hypothetical protein [Poritiphilus flavus]NAS12912.1 hypothetical protein [Poritiphilus flavus]